MAGQVMVIDDQIEVRELLTDLMKSRNRSVRGFADGDQALADLVEHDDVDLVVLDLDLGAGRRDGLAILADLRQRYADLPVVILTGKGTVDDAVRAMQLGASDFIEKDLHLGRRLGLHMDKLERMLAIFEDNKRLRRHNRLLRAQAGMEIELVGAAAGLSRVMAKIHQLAGIPRPVLILGERGTGKELVAAALHRLGQRRDQPFVTINCAALTESLAESELFGHEAGAFTDAREARPGKFELADGGTLFLDEVGNMPLPLQQKFLRAIEYQTFERVGGQTPIRVDVRITAATNADLQAEMEAGRFRRDLYDRLAFDIIQVPPLRSRRQDIPALARHFVARFREEVAGLSCTGISDAALAVIQKLSLPGNVRELKNLIERAAYRCQTETIDIVDLDPVEPGVDRATARGSGFHDRVGAFERQLLKEVLNRHATLAEAADELEVSYDQMRRLVKKHGLQKNQ